MKRCYSCFGEFDEVYNVCPNCGTEEIRDPKEPVHLYPGTVLADRYVLGQSIGAGGFGIVYRAWDLKLETVVAVKEFFASRLVTRAPGQKTLIVTKKSQVEFEYRKERFLAEARNMAKFGTHRNIPNVFEFFEENNTAYIVMELLSGMALNEYLHQNESHIDRDFAIYVATEVGNALSSLHEKNIIHRDVAPDNIFICSGKDIRVKLMDLGAAKLADSTDQVVDIILKPGYSPPEQYDNGKNIGTWTDVYALGASLYVMLTGVKPDESTNRKIKDDVIPPHLLDPSIPENLSNIIMKAMAIEKHMRFKTVAEFLNALNGDKKVVSLDKERKHRKVRRFTGIAVALVIVLLGGLFGLKTYKDKKKAETLEPATLSVWFSVDKLSTEAEAMEAIKEDFESKFPGVKLELKAIPADEYEVHITEAAESGELPNLFESTGVSSAIIDKALSVKNVLDSEQFKNCLFLDQYKSYYDVQKQIPLGIEVPVAFVITSGVECIEYNEYYFESLNDFNYEKIGVDRRHTNLCAANFGVIKKALSEVAFFNNKKNETAVLLSSTMEIKEVRQLLTNYTKKYVYPDLANVFCAFTYEWSIGGGSDCEIAAAEKLLSWMLGNVYQSTLMISKCNDGAIPVNKKSFLSSIESNTLSPIGDIYMNFKFERED